MNAQELKMKHGFDTVFDSQKMFRLILEAMSNPTRKVDIETLSKKFHGEEGAFLAVAMTLLDNEVTFHTCKNKVLCDEITSLTLAKEVPLEQADYIFVTESQSLREAIETAKCGTLADPHKSATIIVKNDGDETESIRLYGAGIKGTNELQTTEKVKIALAVRDSRFFEYPQGVDFIFISKEETLFCIPRLVLREI